MKKISIITSKKYLKSKQYDSLIEILNSKDIEYEILNIDENLDKKITNSNLIISVGGDGTALRAMKINASDKEALATISNIIYSREKDGQLDDSNLSKGEIFLIKRAFLNVWKRIRHRRIQYPTSKNNTFS